jgi:hypothetical protein
MQIGYLTKEYSARPLSYTKPHLLEPDISFISIPNGVSGRYDYLKEIALDYAFLLRELGLV